MPKYLWQVSYTADGTKGLLKEGGSSRRALVDELTRRLGGSMESFYFAFGGDDVFVIAELPDHASAAAVSLAVGATGAANIKTIVLLTPEEVDEATRKDVGYRPPGA